MSTFKYQLYEVFFFLISWIEAIYVFMCNFHFLADSTKVLGFLKNSYRVYILPAFKADLQLD